MLGTASSWLPSISPTFGIALASAYAEPTPVVVADSPAAGPPPVRQAPDAAPAAQGPSSGNPGSSPANPTNPGGTPGTYYPPATPSGKTITARFSFTK